jgi:hypothetical protein
MRPKYISIASTYTKREGAKMARFANCICKCGEPFCCKLSAIKSGNTSSCGCYAREVVGKQAITHGYGTGPKRSIYRTWASMKNRCGNPNDTRFSSYGGRGITVCKEWLKFENFLADMGERPLGRSLDRIDNNKGYFKENCRWATPKEQQRNTRLNKWIEHKGERLTLSDWAKRLGSTNEWIVGSRLKLGWSPEEAVSTPVNKGR